jgi:hypothetical protein
MNRILILAIIALLCSACDGGIEEHSSIRVEERLDPAPYIGLYRLEPSAGMRVKLNGDGTAEVFDPSGKRLHTGRFRSGSRTLRIYLEESQSPFAVFLIQNRVASGWRGRWGEEIKILYPGSL